MGDVIAVNFRRRAPAGEAFAEELMRQLGEHFDAGAIPEPVRASYRVVARAMSRDLFAAFEALSIRFEIPADEERARAAHEAIRSAIEDLQKKVLVAAVQGFTSAVRVGCGEEVKET